MICYNYEKVQSDLDCLYGNGESSNFQMMFLHSNTWIKMWYCMNEISENIKLYTFKN
jgi:hypothetical protein